MWAAQFLTFNKPKHWMTSGGLGTMGYGLPSAMGVQIAHPKDLVIDVAGEASILMNIQELSTIKQYRLPVKIFILNNHYMGMVRQWQELLHGNRLSESYMDSLPDFVKLAESFGAKGLRTQKPNELDDLIIEMVKTKGPVVCDIIIDPTENCFPMIPSGSTHNQMLLGPKDKVDGDISEEGMVLSKMKDKNSKHILSIMVDNEPGVLARVVGLFSGRGYNIESLSVSEVDSHKFLSRITIVTSGTKIIVDQIKAQLNKLIPVHNLLDITELKSFIGKELILIKLNVKNRSTLVLKKKLKDFGVIILIDNGYELIVQFSGTQNEIRKLKK